MAEKLPPASMSGETVPSSWDQIGLEQLRVYARELSEHVREERELRARLEAKNNDLELRVRELSALNALFRRNLERHARLEDSVQRLVAAISQVSTEANRIWQEIEKSRAGDAPPSKPSA